VESTVGVGTTFTLDFPIEPSPKDDPSAQREPSKPQAIDPIEARTVNA
jgi:two-component system NtrC family sensor kinase